MSDIYWDSMLFVYLLGGHDRYSARVEALLTRSYARRDRLFTSCLGLGEVMAGAAKSVPPTKPALIRNRIVEMGFAFLPFDERAVAAFADLRAVGRVKAPDAIHLACAASAKIDLFLTGDKDLLKLDVPGIHFIADFDNSVL